MLHQGLWCMGAHDVPQVFIDNHVHMFDFLDNLAICTYYAKHHHLAIKLNQGPDARIEKNLRFSIDALDT